MWPTTAKRLDEIASRGQEVLEGMADFHMPRIAKGRVKLHRNCKCVGPEFSMAVIHRAARKPINGDR